MAAFNNLGPLPRIILRYFGLLSKRRSLEWYNLEGQILCQPFFQIEQGSLKEGQIPYLTFNLGQFHSHIGCNQFYGHYRKREDEILFPQVMMTLIYCGRYEIVELEYLRALGTSETYSIEGDQLIITYRGGEIRLEGLSPYLFSRHWVD